jgi:hypothetical protein
MIVTPFAIYQFAAFLQNLIVNVLMSVLAKSRFF